MADAGLLQALDFILNQSDEASLDVLAEAVVRRRRNITVFHAVGNIPDPAKMAKQLSAELGGNTEKIIDGMRSSIQEMILRIIRENAPELTDSQVEELCEAWMPGKASAQKSPLPPDILLSMIEQFVSFSVGTMNEKVDQGLREEMGAWTQRYWNAFPPVIRQIITDYLKDRITEKDYKSKVLLALGL
ncbi:MAG: hypothetical protein FWB86_07245 [Treponema sp.]|nr:hypothetical protein [Treponema sp.]MCL2252020.1 hypothetical protein [Treponema sp.]